jgi:hypothetical protein
MTYVVPFQLAPVSSVTFGVDIESLFAHTPYNGRTMFAAVVILLLSLPAPSAGDRSFCTDVANGTYNRNSTYSSNLRSLADDLVAGAMAAHSGTGTAGTGSEKVYGAVLCRGDSTGADCGSLLREAFNGNINANGTGADAVCAQKIGVRRMGGAIHGARCTLRYETDTQFFTATGKLLPMLFDFLTGHISHSDHHN